MERHDSTFGEERVHQVGESFWLEYFDQNYRFEKTFTPQYGTVVRQFEGGEERDDWYLVKLDQAVNYEGATYDHLLISSRWAGERVGGDLPTSIFIVLAPDPETLREPFMVDRDTYIAWGISAKSR